MCVLIKLSNKVWLMVQGRVKSVILGAYHKECFGDTIFLSKGAMRLEISLLVKLTIEQISSASPVTALISSRSNYSSFATIHLDGTVDWMIAQRNALLCWTGQTISLSPRMNTRLVCVDS